ncbi:MAG: cytochrome c-type biogenesis protein CcmH [Gammaproteobacteria bacterium]|nr:cytochrome c-type biogenesis protein CcmH [Gammaproteobacteria bacterium]
MKQYASILVLFLTMTGSVWAGGVEERSFANPEQEQQYKKLVNELRCLVCQNQNLADSNAELAQDLREEIYGMIQKGLDDKQVVEFMVDRYGDFVLYRPPFNAATALLWIGPFLALFFGALIFLMVVRRNKKSATGFHPDATQQARLDQLLKNNERETRP